jgi:hypothetical protein
MLFGTLFARHCKWKVKICLSNTVVDITLSPGPDQDTLHLQAMVYAGIRTRITKHQSQHRCFFSTITSIHGTRFNQENLVSEISCYTTKLDKNMTKTIQANDKFKIFNLQLGVGRKVTFGQMENQLE